MFSATPHVLTSRQERYQGCLDALAQKNIPCHVHIIDTQTPTEDILAAVNAHDLTPRTLIFVPNCWLLPMCSPRSNRCTVLCRTSWAFWL